MTNKFNEKGRSIPAIMMLFGCLVAELYLLYTWIRKTKIDEGATNMGISGAIAITVALITVAGGIWAQVVLFKRDAKRIEEVNNNLGNVRSDTSEMKPDVKTINENIKKVRDEVVEKLVPNMRSSMEKLNGVDILVDAYKISEEFRKRQSPDLEDQRAINGAIENLYRDNSKWRNAFSKEKEKVSILTRENKELQDKIDTLDQQLAVYKEKENNKQRYNGSKI